VELHELHVHQLRTGVVRERGPVGVVLVVPTRVPVVDRGVPAGGEDDHAGVEHDVLARVHVEPDGAVHAVVRGEEFRHHHVLAVGNLERLRAVDERGKHRLAGVVAGERGAAERLRAEEPLVDLAVVGPRVRHPPVVEFAEALGHLARHGLDLRRVVQEVPFVQGVCGVDRPVVLGVVRAEGAVDAAARPRRVCVAVPALPEDEHVVDARLRELDRGSGASGASADHEHGNVDALVLDVALALTVPAVDSSHTRR